MSDENNHCVALKHPGRILLEDVMRPLGVNGAQLARDIDVPIARIRAILAGERGITADTALRLAKHFGTTAELWLKLQADYDLMILRSDAWHTIEPRIRVFAGKRLGTRSAPELPEPTAPTAAHLRSSEANEPPRSESTQKVTLDELSLSEVTGSAVAKLTGQVDEDELPPLELTERVELDEPPVLELTERVDADQSVQQEPRNLRTRPPGAGSL